MTLNFGTRPKRLDESRTSLTFTDVIFGLVISEIFIRAAALNTLSTAVDVHLALCLAVVLGSYIGYRASLKRSTYRLAFFNLPLLRFMLDLFMIFLYYVITITPDETKNHSAPVHPRVDTLVVLLIFGAYLAWDLVSKWMAAKDYTDVHFQWNRTIVTCGGLVAAGIVFGVAWTASSPLSQHLAIIVDSLLIAIAILYRWVKDSIQSVEVKRDLASDMGIVRDAFTKLEETIAKTTGQ